MTILPNQYIEIVSDDLDLPNIRVLPQNIKDLLPPLSGIDNLWILKTHKTPNEPNHPQYLLHLLSQKSAHQILNHLNNTKPHKYSPSSSITIK